MKDNPKIMDELDGYLDSVKGADDCTLGRNRLRLMKPRRWRRQRR